MFRSYGRPTVSDELYSPAFTREHVLPIVAAMERYSHHPLAAAIVRAAADARLPLPDVEWIREEAGVGLRGRVGNADVLITNRTHAAARFTLPPGQPTGLECVVVIDDQYAAIFRLRGSSSSRDRRSSTGMFTAPGMLPAENSCGVRTSSRNGR